MRFGQLTTRNLRYSRALHTTFNLQTGEPVYRVRRQTVRNIRRNITAGDANAGSVLIAARRGANDRVFILDAGPDPRTVAELYGLLGQPEFVSG